jgi:hypothetical protein
VYASFAISSWLGLLFTAKTAEAVFVSVTGISAVAGACLGRGEGLRRARVGAGAALVELAKSFSGLRFFAIEIRKK